MHQKKLLFYHKRITKKIAKKKHFSNQRYILLSSEKAEIDSTRHAVGKIVPRDVVENAEQMTLV
jgi:hypothetical protein